MDTLATPDDWHGVLVTTREWLGPANRAQLARALRAGSPDDDFPSYVFGARRLLRVGDATFQMLALSVLDEFGDPGRLPYSIKVVLENVVPQAAGSRVSGEGVAWPAGRATRPAN